MRALVAQGRRRVGRVQENIRSLLAHQRRELPEARELGLEVLASAALELVRGREMGPEAGQLEALVGGDRVGDRERLGGIGLAEPAHAGVVLDVELRPDPERRAEPSRRPRPPIGSRPRSPTRRAAPARAREPRAPPSSGSGPRETARGSRPPRPTVATPSVARAAGERRTCRRDGAVAVAVALDDGAELGCPRPSERPRARQLRSIAPRSTRATARSGPSAGTPTRPRRSPGRARRAAPRSRRSRSPTPRRAGARPRCPARPWACTAAQVAANGSIPRASRAATVPVRTSPVPAVASAGLEIALIASRSPSPLVGDDRVVALEDDDRAAAPRRLAGVLEAALADRRRLGLEQPAELALVRGEHGRVRPRLRAIPARRRGR